MAKKSYYICSGPFRKELFRGLELYGKKRKLIFDVSVGKAGEFNGNEYEVCHLIGCMEIYVFEVKALLIPTFNGEGITIDMVKDYWQIRGFIEIKEGFKEVSLGYNTKDREGSIYIEEE